jgi:hypothetical protein
VLTCVSQTSIIMDHPVMERYVVEPFSDVADLEAALRNDRLFKYRRGDDDDR